MSAPYVVHVAHPDIGEGLFAARTFRKGERVVEYTGERIPTAYADTLRSRYLFELDERWTIDAEKSGGFGRFVNHSCVPNCEARIESGRIFFYAMRTVERGEEITIDYGEEYFEDFIRPVGCKCARCTDQIDEMSVSTKEPRP